MLPFCLDSDIMEILSLLSLFAPKISSVLEAFALILSLCPLHEFSLACANEYIARYSHDIKSISCLK